VINGFRCERWSNTSDDAGDQGTPLNFIDDKVHSKLTCNSHISSTNKSHHVYVSNSLDDQRFVADNSVAFNRIHPEINAALLSVLRSAGLRYW